MAREIGLFEDEAFSSPSAAFRMPNRLMFGAWLLVVLFVFGLVEGVGQEHVLLFVFLFSFCCVVLVVVFLCV